MNRQEAIAKFPILPLQHYDKVNDEYVYSGEKTFASYVLTLPSKSFRGHQKMLGTQIVLLGKLLGFEKMIFLGDSDIAWLGRLNMYESFQEALQYLVDLKIGKRFNGALQVDMKELPLFIKNLSWLVRTNGVVQYIHFTDPGQNFVASFCQYGNLHISTKNKKADKDFKAAIDQSDFIYVPDFNCYNKFSKTGAIKGRMPTYYSK